MTQTTPWLATNNTIYTHQQYFAVHHPVHMELMFFFLFKKRANIFLVHIEICSLFYFSWLVEGANRINSPSPKAARLSPAQPASAFACDFCTLRWHCSHPATCTCGCAKGKTRRSDADVDVLSLLEADDAGARSSTRTTPEWDGDDAGARATTSMP
jgi:hypothetical protein